ncbi:Sjogren's syndrome/scleroderma autoantigen 1 family protein [Halostella pelagica]|uniref:Sjogren's syndrome/scleroderma autoantigen 1 family protein n=1 Tax=Halostella pelagica TaxID=2583824 RepID=UPI0010822643|nr:Sjogren's syndrome/scleroderma autoantigen 1 family protein [Halostella pelagica]
MSDFDKEAEREKLREQFEEEESDRQHTQQLSELLLKGATMTNNHCDRCGDPIFRYDGQAFCPTCQSEGQAAGGGAQGGGNAQANPQNQRSATNAERPETAERAVESDDTDAAAGPTANEAAPQADVSRPADPKSSFASAPANASGRSAGPTPAEVSSEAAPESGDVAAAQEALRATLTKFSRKAAETDDPRRARECLAAAREAAEALDTLPY